jgi:6-phosphogluconolactonase
MVAMLSEVEIFSERSELFRAEAERIVMLAKEASDTRGRCLVALSGGSTPRPLYELLATAPYATRIDWSRMHLFWGDERCVPPEHPDSNYRMTREALIDRVPLPPENVHRIRGEDRPERAAAAYELLLRKFFGPSDTPARTFDLVLLGLGRDGHTASIFPGTAAMAEARRWAMAVHIEEPRDMWRVTLTTVVLNAAADVTFLVAGADKAPRLREVLHAGVDRRPSLPAQLVKPSRGALHWMVDSAAGAELAGLSSRAHQGTPSSGSRPSPQHRLHGHRSRSEGCPSSRMGPARGSGRPRDG